MGHLLKFNSTSLPLISLPNDTITSSLFFILGMLNGINLAISVALTIILIKSPLLSNLTVLVLKYSLIAISLFSNVCVLNPIGLMNEYIVSYSFSHMLANIGISPSLFLIPAPIKNLSNSSFFSSNPLFFSLYSLVAII